jgi:hypothetical protein
VIAAILKKAETDWVSEETILVIAHSFAEAHGVAKKADDAVVTTGAVDGDAKSETDFEAERECEAILDGPPARLPPPEAVSDTSPLPARSVRTEDLLTNADFLRQANSNQRPIKQREPRRWS